MKIKSITKVGKADVFNMEVEDTHSFVIQGGVISHNCADSLRYLCMLPQLKIQPPKTVSNKHKGVNPLDSINDTNNKEYRFYGF